MCLFSNLIVSSKRSIFFAQYIVFGNNSRVGWGGVKAGTFPLKSEKIVVEIWCYLPEVYTFREEAELQEIFIRNLWKKSISIEIFNQKISKFSRNFSRFSSFLVQTRRVLQAPCLVLPAQSKSFIRSQLPCFFYKFPSIFSKDFNKFHAIFKSP